MRTRWSYIKFGVHFCPAPAVIFNCMEFFFGEHNRDCFCRLQIYIFLSVCKFGYERLEYVGYKEMKLVFRSFK